MMKTIDVIAAIPTPLTLQEKNSGGSIMPYENTTPVWIYNTVSSMPDRQKQLIFW